MDTVFFIDNYKNYSNLPAFLKRKLEGYQAKKSETFTLEEINIFMNDAPDEKYLPTKVIYNNLMNP